MKYNEKLKKAQDRVLEIKGFYVHGIVYCVINFLLFMINKLTAPDYYWFYWPLMGWGIGLFFHWFSVYGIPGFLDSRWEEKKVREVIKKMK